MSYVAQLHQITPEIEMIFPLLWYCQRKQWAWVARWEKVTEGRAGPRMAHGWRCVTECPRVAGKGVGWQGGALGRGAGPWVLALWGGIEGEDGRGSSPRGAGEQVAICGLLSYPIEQGRERGIDQWIGGYHASGFGLPILAVPTAGQLIGRATGQPSAIAPHPPHPSPPPPSAGGHTAILR